MENEKNASKRGGARPGAGRKPKGYECTAVSFRVENELLQELREYCANNSVSQSDVISAALAAYIKTRRK